MRSGTLFSSVTWPATIKCIPRHALYGHSAFGQQAVTTILLRLVCVHSHALKSVQCLDGSGVVTHFDPEAPAWRYFLESNKSRVALWGSP